MSNGFLTTNHNNLNKNYSIQKYNNNNKKDDVRMIWKSVRSGVILVTNERSLWRLSAVSTKSGGRSIESLQSFEREVLTDGGSKYEIVMAFYTAPWCGPCRLSNPVVKEIAKEFSGKIDVVEVCTDDIPEIPEMTGVESIPTIQIFHQGTLKETIVGCVAKNVLASALDKLIDEAS